LDKTATVTIQVRKYGKLNAVKIVRCALASAQGWIVEKSDACNVCFKNWSRCDL